jgi:hypothetical protein
MKTIEVNPAWEELGYGRHRVVYKLPSGNVIKFPKGPYGEVANRWEALVWKCRNNLEALPQFIQDCLIEGTQFARCRLIPGTKVLIMEGVVHTGYRSDYPWTRKIDLYQVGKNKAGKIVAYDYAEFYDRDADLAALAVKGIK